MNTSYHYSDDHDNFEDIIAHSQNLPVCNLCGKYSDEDGNHYECELRESFLADR